MAAYDAKFYDTIRDGIRRSAEAVVPLLIEQLDLDPGDVVLDVGCGEGWWARTFADNGMEAWGTDGDWHGDHMLEESFFPSDLANGLLLFEHRADVVVCLEVAEHLPEQRASSFIAELCSIAPVVVFSAAIPGQGGTGHVNEQWPDYWADQFACEGYDTSGAFRFEIWEDGAVENWYRQNMLIAMDATLTGDYPNLFDVPTCHPFPMVHPVLYDARRKR